MEGLKSTILKQDIALAKKLQNVGNWKKRLNFNDDELRERQKSKFHGHPRAIDESEEESDPSPPTPSSSVSSINANLFKEEIIRQALNGNQMVKDFSVMLNQEQNHDYVSPKNDLIFGGDNLDFLQNYNKSMKDKRTKKYVDSAIEMKTSENRRSKVRVFEEKNRRKLKIDNRKCSNVQKNDIIDSLFDKKFKVVVEKILHGLNDVLLILEKGTPEADGEEDYVKRFDRVKGFSSRFVRNYLYPLEQQLKCFEHGKPQTPNQKLITCYHLVCQGVQSYHNHLPTSVGKCAFEKMISLMSDLIKICDVHVGLIENLDESVSQEYIYSLKKKGEQLIPKLTEIFRSKSNESLLKSNNTRTTLVSKNAKSTKNNKNRKFQNRYAMYSSSNFYRKDVAFKKAMDQVSKKKFDVKSKYKTATFKHRPPVEKIEETNGNIFQNPKSFFAKRSSSIIRSSPVLSARIDDTVKTQIEVETLQPHTTPNDSKENISHDQIQTKLLQLVQNNSDVKCSSQEESREVRDMLHEYFRNKEGKQILQELADELQKEHAECKENVERKLSKTKLDVVENKTPDTARSKKEPIITITGPKNAKLICIKDENSEDEKSNTNHRKNVQDVGVKRAPLKLTRMPKNFRCLSFFEDSHAINIIQYKLEFRNACKNNPLYMKTTNLQPWLLMGKFSDSILDYAVLEVAKEIELNNIPDQVYQEEMQI